MRNFKTENDFIQWYKQIIENDFNNVHDGNIPSYFFQDVLWNDFSIQNDYHKLSEEEQFKKRDKKVIKRLSSIRNNLTINIENLDDINSRILNDEVLTLINDVLYLLPNNYEQLEPHHYYIFLHTVEQIKFFIKSKMMSSYDNLFSIRKDKYDEDLEKLQSMADRLQFFFDDELIDNQMRIRIPINPKVSISQMIWALELQGDKNNILAKLFYERIIDYFGGNSDGAKLIRKDLFNNFFIKNKTSYGIIKENLLQDTLYFYKPSLGLNYKS